MNLAELKYTRLAEINAMLPSLNRIFGIATNNSLQLRVLPQQEIVQFVNSEGRAFYEMSYKDQSVLGFVKNVMSQI